MSHHFYVIDAHSFVLRGSNEQKVKGLFWILFAYGWNICLIFLQLIKEKLN